MLNRTDSWIILTKLYYYYCRKTNKETFSWIKSLFKNSYVRLMETKTLRNNYLYLVSSFYFLWWTRVDSLTVLTAWSYKLRKGGLERKVSGNLRQVFFSLLKCFILHRILAFSDHNHYQNSIVISFWFLVCDKTCISKIIKQTEWMACLCNVDYLGVTHVSSLNSNSLSLAI